ncbi:MAG: DUF2298 domain-containing protein [Anaerolineae bacterium]
MYNPESDVAVSQPAVEPRRPFWESARRYAVPIALAFILLLGAVFRFTGLNWDDFQHLHPDERFLTMVETGISFPGSPDISGQLPPGCTKWGGYFDTACSPLNPYNRGFGNFVYGTFPLFLVKVAGDLLNPIYQVVVGLTGQQDLARIDLGGYDGIHLVGRVFSGLFDLSTVLLIFLIGRRLFSQWVGLLAALLLSGSVLDIQQSHFFTVDTFANVPLLIAFWFTLDIFEGKRGWLAYVFAGIFFGLSLAARINLAPFAGIIAIAGAYRFAQVMRGDGSKPAAISPTEATTFAATAESVADVGPDNEAPVDPVERSRTMHLGPLSLEIQSHRRPSADLSAGVEMQDEDRPAWWEMAAIIGLELALSAVAALIAFRIAQPYAFQNLGLNPKFLQDMSFARDLIAGNIDMPPMHQWTARPDYWFPWVNMVLWGLGPGLGLAGTLGFFLAGYELLFKREWKHLTLFFWVGGLFLYMGQQVAKTDRYYLPLYPFIALLAAYVLIRLWQAARSRVDPSQGSSQFSGDGSPVSRFESLISGLARYRLVWQVLAGILIVAATGYTLFWAAAFTSIYTRPVSRVTASRWIYQNILPGAALGNEHWDDPLPLRIDGKDGFGGFYQGVELQWYGEDTPEKRDQAIGWLDQVQYINLTSNRLYLSIPRLPLRYPMTTLYYEKLFSGDLGFRLVNTFTSRPSFLGIEINDDDAEESFTVYDHPKVLIFEKTPAYSHDKIAALFNSVDLTDVIRQKPLDATESHNAFQLNPQDLQADQTGGTWAQIFNPDDFINQVPLLVWVALLELLGMVMFPLSFLLFRRFGDRGYAFSKALGVLALGWGAWTLASYHVMPFSRENILVVLGVLVAVALFLTWRQWSEIIAFLRTRLSTLLVAELVFWGFFGISLLIRYGNPDLWHPSFGGEKPMDFAYLNAIIKTTWFPPYNPWFDGGYINYYYFGQVLSATLVRLTGIVPEVAYNLLLPMFFGLTASGAFGVVSNLVRAIQSSRVAARAESAEGEQPVPLTAGQAPDVTPAESLAASAEVRKADRRAWAAGVFAAFLVLIIGNLAEIGVLYTVLMRMGQESGGGSGAFALLRGLSAWLVQHKQFPIGIGDWYWTATRVIPDTINEFPFFTFLYADLHAHLMVLAFTLVALGFAVHAVLLRGRLKWYDLGMAALVLGALRAINTWDYPTYLAVVGGAMVIGLLSGPLSPEGSPRPGWMGYLSFIAIVFVQVMLAVIPINALGVKITIDVGLFALIVVFGVMFGWIREGSRFDPRQVAVQIGWRMIALVALSALLYFPYLLFYGAGYTSVDLWTGDRTGLGQYLVVWGIFIFMVATYLVVANLRPHLLSDGQRSPAAQESTSDWWIYGFAGILALAIVLFLAKLVVFAIVLPLVALGAWLFLRRDTTPEVRLVALLAMGGLLLTAMVEVITLKGDIGRMNTVFKFYLQTWVLFSVVSAVGLALIWDRINLFKLFRAKAPASAMVAPVPAPVETTATLSTESGRVPAPVSESSAGFSFPVKPLWWAALGILILVGLLYPIFATWAKVNDRYVPDSPPGLNGMNYMLGATYGENGHDITLAPDHAAIEWIRENIPGSPVIVEANTGLYRWGDRVSINTGLPTVIGWDWHTKQQYALLDGAIIDQRLAELRAFYNNPDPNTTGAFIKRYNVSYIYVGPLERAVYEASGLSKFEAMAQAGALTKVYDANTVQIYKVVPAATALNK